MQAVLCNNLGTTMKRVVVLGLPLDENSSYLRGAAEAPGKIRQALRSGSSNLCSETGLDLGCEPGFADDGDLALPAGGTALDAIASGIGVRLDAGARVLALGGDHSVTVGAVRAFARRHPGLEILHLDAHPDLYDEFEGSRDSHACPFARIMEERLAARLVQVGIRTMNRHQREQAARFGVEVVEMRHWRERLDLWFSGPLYLSIDMDVLDPSAAPGVSHREPGGATTRQVIDLVHAIDVPLVGADIVEFNPRLDPSGITAMCAAKLLKEVAAKMLSAP
jgi:agmatinase